MSQSWVSHLDEDEASDPSSLPQSLPHLRSAPERINDIQLIVSNQTNASSLDLTAEASRAVSPEAAREKVKVDLAISLEGVRGSQANFIQAIIAMIVSITATLAGLAAVDDIDGGGSAAVGGMGSAKAVFGFATLLFVCTGLNLSKAVRDRSFADAFTQALGVGPSVTLKTQLRGSTASLYASIFAMAASLFLAGASIIQLNGRGTSANHLFAGLAFCLSSTVTVAKVVRDRFDADFLEGCSLAAPPLQLVRIMVVSEGLIGGTQAFFYLSLCSALVSVISVIIVILLSGLDVGNKIIVSVCVIFLAVASINVSKMVRDKLDRSRGAAQNTTSWNLITTISFVIAVVAAAAGSYAACLVGVLSHSMCAFVVTGMCWVLASVLTFSKVARDHEERSRKLAK